MKTHRMHVISHTHWDREWYQPFQDFRMRLVYQIDQLIDILESQPDYKCFHLDGQTCCLQDYLEIRPENKDILQKYIGEGRILIGPWYVMPDEFLVSGESLIRNLQLGISTCRSLKVEPMAVGYVTDIFGHNSQFPQILNGFNLKNAFLHRGTISDDDEKTETIWEGADGSRVLLIKVLKSTGYNEVFLRDWVAGGHEEEIKRYEEEKIALATTPVLFTMQGNDHTPAYIDEKEFIEKANKAFEKIEVLHSTFNEYLSDVTSHIDFEKLNTVKGELRTPAVSGSYIHVFFGTGSSRFDLKKANDQCEYLLTRFAEPLNVWSRLFGGDDNTAFINKAWQYLLLNQPHDSICGCSVDQVHKDMHYRFEQCRMIAESCISEAVREIARKIEVDKETLSVTVFNMANVTRRVSGFELEIPITTLNQFRDSMEPVFVNSKGEEFPAAISEINLKKRSDFFMKKTYWGKTRCYGLDFERADGTENPTIAHLYVDAQLNVPPLSFNTFTVKFRKAASKLVTKKNRIENDCIRISVNGNGTLDLLDKKRNKLFEGICGLEDCGDRGSGWDHSYPMTDKKLLSKEWAYDIAITCSENHMKSEIEVSYKWSVPKSLDQSGQGRADETAVLEVTNIYTLQRDKAYFSCKTRIVNTAEDHRIRVLLPTGLSAETVSYDTPFDIVEVPVALTDTTGFVEEIREEHPMKNFVFLKDRSAGIGVVTKGLCEGFASDDESKTMGITLFRSFSHKNFMMKSQDSQHPGILDFEYAVVLAGNEEEMVAAAEDYKVPVIAYSHINRYLDPIENTVPADSVLLDMDGLEFSAMTLDGSDVIVRGFNPYGKAVDGKIKPGFAYDKKQSVNFLNEAADETDKIAAKKIVNRKYTVRVRKGGCKYD